MEKINLSMSDTYFLAMTAIPELWDFNKSIIFLGEWCLRFDLKDQWKNINSIVLKYPISNSSDVHEFSEYVKRIYEILIVDFTDRFNNLHGTSYSNKYWEIVFGSFLITYIKCVYGIYLSLSKALEYNSNIETLGLNICQLPPFLSSRELVLLLIEGNDFLYHRIYTQCAEYFNIPLSYKRIEQPNTLKISNMNIHEKLNYLIMGIRGRLYKFIFSQGFRSNICIYQANFSFINSFLLLLLSKFKAWPFTGFTSPSSKNEIDINKRKYLLSPNGNDKFINFVLQSLIYNLPLCFLENFHDIRNCALKYRNINSPQKIITAQGFYWDNVFAAWAAECHENNKSELIGVQHGGSYGEIAFSIDEFYERSVTNKFITWGWFDKDCVPLPATKLIGNHSKKRSNSENILLVGVQSSRYSTDMYLNYISQTIFYEKLKDELKKRLVLRLHENLNYKWLLKQRWISDYPNVNIYSGKSKFIKHVKQSRIVVVGYLFSTPFLEVINLNKPVLVFKNTNCSDFRDSAKYHYRILQEVGIIHYSPESAAQLLNEIYPYIEEWWNESNRQKAIREFVRNYAYSTHHRINDLKKWINYFKS